MESRPFAKSTLQLFRAQLILHEKMRLPLDRSLQIARKRGFLKTERKLKLALDTTNVLGWGAVKDTYNLLADGIVVLMRRPSLRSWERIRQTLGMTEPLPEEAWRQQPREISAFLRPLLGAGNAVQALTYLGRMQRPRAPTLRRMASNVCNANGGHYGTSGTTEPPITYAD